MTRPLVIKNFKPALNWVMFIDLVSSRNVLDSQLHPQPSCHWSIVPLIAWSGLLEFARMSTGNSRSSQTMLTFYDARPYNIIRLYSYLFDPRSRHYLLFPLTNSFSVHLWALWDDVEQKKKQFFESLKVDKLTYAHSMFSEHENRH